MEMKIALFIDGDNIGHEYCQEILNAAQKVGVLQVKMVFGRCTTFVGKGWKDAAHEQGIQIYPQVNNLKGKSAADIALVIEVMKQLDMNTCTGIVIASNDTDYTALVYEIRKRGYGAYCLVSKPTDNVYAKACTNMCLLKKPDNRSVVKCASKTTTVSKVVANAKTGQPKKGTYKQIAVKLRGVGCRTEKAIRNKIKSDYQKSDHEIDSIINKMKEHSLVLLDVNGKVTWPD